jgi:hypothetical protein
MLDWRKCCESIACAAYGGRMGGGKTPLTAIRETVAEDGLSGVCAGTWRALDSVSISMG